MENLNATTKIVKPAKTTKNLQSNRGTYGRLQAEAVSFLSPSNIHIILKIVTANIGDK